MTSDIELMTAFQQGDREAFEKLVMRHQVGLFNFFLRLVGRRDLAEDMTQEVFFRVYLHASTYVGSAKFTTYLYRIAKNCWIDHVRRTGRRGRTESLDKENEYGQTLSDRLPHDSRTPEEHMASRDRCEAIQAAIDNLPDEQRVVFVLSEVQGMKYAEIAETLDIPVGTVKSRMHVAINRLREGLNRMGFGDA